MIRIKGREVVLKTWRSDTEIVLRGVMMIDGRKAYCQVAWPIHLRRIPLSVVKRTIREITLDMEIYLNVEASKAAEVSQAS